jgi:hypothetical protein
MLSTSSLLVLLVAVLVNSIVHALPLNGSLCDPHIQELNKCNIGVGFAAICNSSTLNLVNTNLSNSCSSVNIFWSYPMNNLTVVIETPYTQQRQPYTIHLHSRQLKSQISHIYRLLQGQEIERTKIGNTVIEKSDSNYQVILKFQAPTQLKFYGLFIAYDIVKD